MLKVPILLDLFFYSEKVRCNRYQNKCLSYYQSQTFETCLISCSVTLRNPYSLISCSVTLRNPSVERDICMETYTAHKMKFFIKYFFSKCDQIRIKLRIWSHLLKKSSMEKFIFCAVISQNLQPVCDRIYWHVIETLVVPKKSLMYSIVCISYNRSVTFKVKTAVSYI